MKRRSFLGWTSAAAATAVLTRFAKRSWADPFGEPPSSAASVMLPENRRAKRVLEVFLYGGISQWETLYLVRNYGRPTDPQYANQQYYTFDFDGQGGTRAAYQQCGLPAGGEIGQAFAKDADGADVELGPFARRLWPRTDILDRMRLVVQRHKLEPHEAAVPQALTGRPVGQPSAAGLGSHIQRYLSDREGPERSAPWSYVFATGGISGDNVSAAAATGAHPGRARPLLVKIDNAASFARLLARAEVSGAGDKALYDALERTYVADYGKRLTWKGGQPVRANRYGDLAVAAGTVERTDAIRGVLDAPLFTDRAGAACGDSTQRDIPGMSLNAARALLTHPTQPARYVCVSDVGLREASGGGGYDTHSQNAYDTARNFDNMLRSLLSIINAPGENDPTKLSLDDTLIILNTEFGRTPWSQDGGDGRNHHPYGYVTAFIGATVSAAEKGIYGAIGPDGVATTAATPAENRIGALLSLGIWPFAQEAFAVSDVTGAASEEEAVKLATQRILGVSL
ncbi:MAG: DUF1501 domain-containing protein [Deltaproteobacteria bacterium]|nr:DUF1501 domain-containing protein [Deltaproteobacteria bacterium]